MDLLRPSAPRHFSHRRTSAGRPIPYRVPGYPWTPLIFVLVAAVIVGNANLSRLP